MKALVWYGEQALRCEEIRNPEPRDDEIVLDVEVAGICGSDLHAYRGHPGPRVPPLVLGHEVVGRFEGRSYTVYPLLACGTCSRCRAGQDNLCSSWQLIGMHRPGVFAERVAIARDSLVPVPAGMEPERAVLAEPMACCVGALAPHEVGEATRIVVLGCGPIGILTVFVAARRGAEVVAVDPVSERRVLARRLGAARTLTDPTELTPAAASVAVDAAGFESTWRGAIDAVQTGGTVVVLGLGDSAATFPMAVVVRRAITVRGQFAYSRADFSQAVELLSRGDLDLGWISTTTLNLGAQAFANLVEQPARFSKVILRPTAA